MILKLSIIIPCFNSSKTIIRTLESILGLKKYEVEIIIVNDGSSDDTLNKVELFFNKNSFIHKIHNQVNLGLSEARNNGLKIARGKYIWFVDSDDMIKCNEIKLLFNLFKKEIDLIFFPILKKTEKVVFLKNNFKTNYRLIGVPFYIYKRDFLLENNLFFVPKLIHEDLEFLPRVFSKFMSISKFDFPLYKQIITPNSLTTSDVKFSRVKSLIDIAIFHNRQYINGDKKYFDFYSLISLNSAFLLSFKLGSEDYLSFKNYLKENIKSINSILKVKIFNLTKLKSIISILFFNLIIFFKNE